MFVAVCDQDFGTSTLSCRKIVWPFSFPMSAGRRSHSTASKGEVLPSAKRRRNSSPVIRRVSVCISLRGFVSIFDSAILGSAISASAQAAVPPNLCAGLPAGRDDTPILLPSAGFRATQRWLGNTRCADRGIGEAGLARGENRRGRNESAGKGENRKRENYRSERVTSFVTRCPA